MLKTRLTCAILGDDSDHIFQVRIALTDNTVYDLKEAIKEQRHITFRDVDADSLQLWKVNIDTRERLDLPPDVKPLKADIPLSEVFTAEPEARHLHIFVECEIVQPLLATRSLPASHRFINLNCIILGDDSSHMFTVKIALTSNVYGLKEAIKQKKHITFCDIDADSLQLWKVDFDPHKGNLDLPGGVEELVPFTPLSEVFLVEPKAKHLHIFVQRPRHGPYHQPQLSPSAYVLKIQRLRSDYTQNFPKMAPSSQGAPSEFKIMQNNPDNAVRWDRPPEAASIIPCTLLHPVFGAFMDDCEDHEPTADDNNLAMELSNAMSHFATNEGERASKFRQVLMKHNINIIPTGVDGTLYTTDGDVQHKGFRFVIAEMKNEIGSTNSEPHMEALSYYIHSTNPFAQDNPAFRFPCILISLFGPHMDFSAAVWDTRPNMQVISAALPLYYHRTDTKMREMVGRHLGALKKALHSLLECYKNMAPSTKTPSTDTNPCFPYPSSYTCIKTSATCRFKYHAQMDAQKLLFSVKTTDNKTLCIKFVRHYSKEVHQRCASGGFAPALYGFENLPGGWFMIVMEMITEDYCCLAELSAPFPHHDALATKLQSLHQDGYVHGDIRDINVMVKRDCSPGFKLVDFDWSGKIGEIRYPMNVYRGGRLWRPDGAEDGQLILAEHDIQMLHAMFPPGTFL